MNDTLLIFDLDGTLWDSCREVADSWNIILRKHLPGRKELTAADICSVMGKTMTEIADTLMPDLDPALRTKVFSECETFEVSYIKEHGAQLFPGVRETLEKLHSAGFSLAIVSNCQIGYIDAFLCSMDLNSRFCDYEEWGNTGKSKAENIRLVMERNGFEKAVYIGDIESDMISSMDAGIPFIHAAYGFGKIDNAPAAISCFSELADLLIGR